MHGTYQKFHPSEHTVPNTSRDRAADGDTLIGVASAAALLGVHPNTIRSWTEAGRLLAYRINARGDRRYRRGDVERLLVEGTNGEAEHLPLADSHDPQLAVLARLTQGTIGITSATAVCRVVVEALRAHLGISRAAVYLARGDEAGDLALETHAGYRTAPAPTITLLSPLEAGERLFPLRAAGSDVGALLVTIDPTQSRPVDHTFLEAVAASLAAHVRNARILARARRELTRSRALRAVLQELTGQLELATVLEEVVTRTRTLFEADKAGLWLIANDEHPFREAAVHGLGSEFLASVRSVTWDADAIGRPRAARAAPVRHARGAHRQGDRPAPRGLCGGRDPDRLPRAADRQRRGGRACSASTTSARGRGRARRSRWRRRSPTRRRSPSATRASIGPSPTRQPGCGPSRICRPVSTA